MELTALLTVSILVPRAASALTRFASSALRAFDIRATSPLTDVTSSLLALTAWNTLARLALIRLSSDCLPAISTLSAWLVRLMAL